MQYTITDEKGNEVAVITSAGGKFTIELDTDNYTLKTTEKTV